MGLMESPKEWMLVVHIKTKGREGKESYIAGGF